MRSAIVFKIQHKDTHNTKCSHSLSIDTTPFTMDTGAPLTILMAPLVMVMAVALV